MFVLFKFMARNHRPGPSLSETQITRVLRCIVKQLSIQIAVLPEIDIRFSEDMCNRIDL